MDSERKLEILKAVASYKLDYNRIVDGNCAYSIEDKLHCALDGIALYGQILQEILADPQDKKPLADCSEGV